MSIIRYIVLMRKSLVNLPQLNIKMGKVRKVFCTTKGSYVIESWNCVGESLLGLVA